MRQQIHVTTPCPVSGFERPGGTHINILTCTCVYTYIYIYIYTYIHSVFICVFTCVGIYVSVYRHVLVVAGPQMLLCGPSTPAEPQRLKGPET